ncbi:MAG: WD40 repeat domain-containing protein [Bacteroidota bacterium]
MKKLFNVVFAVLIFQLTLVAQVNPVLQVNGHNESVNVVAFSPDSKTLFSGGKDGAIFSWDVTAAFKQVKTIHVTDAAITSLSVNHAGNTLVVGTYCQILLYDAASLKRKARNKKAHVSFAGSVNYSADDNYIVSSSWKENALMLWDAKNLKKVKQFAETVWTDEAMFTQDGKYIISANHANNVKVWDIATGNIVKTFAGHEDWVYAFRMTNDQSKLITASFDKTIKIWDFESGKQLSTLQGHTDGIYQLALTPDNKTLISVAVDSTMRVWDLEKKAEVANIKPASKVLGITISPDGRYLAAGLEDHSIAIWELKDLIKGN